jgi:hypothetical protein
MVEDEARVHRRHHLVTRDVIGPIRHTVPGALRRVGLIRVDLGIDNRHRGSSSVLSRFMVWEPVAPAGRHALDPPLGRTAAQSQHGCAIESTHAPQGSASNGTEE